MIRQYQRLINEWCIYFFLFFQLSDTTSDALITALHASPEDAILISRDVQARHSIAMHFATFAGSEHEAMEPLIRLVECREELLGFEKGKGGWEEGGGFGAVHIGGGGVVRVGG